MGTLVTSHSGGLGVPANSRLYMEKARSKRPDIVEVDVRRTADGIPVLSHDPRLIPGGGLLAAMSLKQARGIHPGLLTLGEAIDFWGEDSPLLNLDIKEREVIPPAVAAAKASGKDFLFSGCGKNEVQQVLALWPKAQVLYNLPEWDPARNYREYAQEAVAVINDLECLGINISCQSIRPELMDYARAGNIPVFVWTVDDRLTMDALIQLGVFSITTNQVERLQEAVKAAGPGDEN